jgi:hypothetical protein
MFGLMLAHALGFLFVAVVLPVILAISAIVFWRCLIPPRPTARYRTRGSLPLALACWSLLVAIGSIYAFFNLNPNDVIVINTYRDAAPASGQFPRVESWANGGSTEAHQMLRLTGAAATALFEIDFNTDLCIVADANRVHITSGPYDASKLEKWFEAAGFDPALPASQAQIAEIADFIARVRPVPEGDARFRGPLFVDSQPGGFTPQPPTLRDLPTLHAGYLGLLGCTGIGIVGAILMVRRRRKLLSETEPVK